MHTGGKYSYHQWRPHLGEVLAAIHSLYADEVKPVSRILRKRAVELLGSSTGIDCKQLSIEDDYLRILCAEADCLSVQEEEGGTWSGLLVGQPTEFVDVFSSEDPYSVEFWSSVAAYFERVVASGTRLKLPGGRYECAKVLKQRLCALTSELTLGRMCHVVQLAITQKKILGYLGGHIVPYSQSYTMTKDDCAVKQQPCRAGSKPGQVLPLASLDLAYTCLREILQTSQGTNRRGEVVMSNVKRIFRSRFGIQLSETSLGYNRLYELLQDSRFSDLCTVELRDNGYIVVEKAGRDGRSRSTSGSGLSVASVATGEPSLSGEGLGYFSDHSAQSGSRSCRSDPLAYASLASGGSSTMCRSCCPATGTCRTNTTTSSLHPPHKVVVKNTFIHISSERGDDAVRRYRSLPPCPPRSSTI